MKPSDFRAIIKKLGRVFELREKGSDHVDYEIRKNGVLITWIRSSMAPKDWQDNLIAKNLHISTTHLKEFTDCTFSNEDLIAELKRKQRWPSNL